MLAKVVTLKHGAPSKGFAPVLRYILRIGAQANARQIQDLESGHVRLLDDPFCSVEDDAAGYAQDVAHLWNRTVERCRRRGRFHGNPVYHVAINWMSGEYPTRAQAQRASEHVMAALGFSECAAVWSLHRDTDHDHVHLVINRVHPTKLTAISVPRRDYLLLDRCMRELESEFGCVQAPGPYVTVETAEGPRIVRMSRAERQARGLLNPDSPRLTPRAQRAERNLGVASFQSWLAGAPSAALHRALAPRAATWQHAHAALAAFACAIQPKGSGLVVTTTLSDGRVLAAKASVMGRWASKSALEQRLGAYEGPGSLSRRHPSEKAYERYVQREHERQGRPRASRDEQARMERRAARANARRTLAERFAQEQAQRRAQRMQQRQAVRKRQIAERTALVAAHREQRARTRASARGRRQDGRLALSLWAFRAAVERERQQRRHEQERRALTDALPRTEVWRLWLERQAALGDEAAVAALRGIRYRQRRREHQDGIEGQTATPLRSLAVGRLKAEIDRAQLIVIYRQSDGTEVFRDIGPRIVMCDRSDVSLEAALRVAAQKYAGRVHITGSDSFRERAARMATRMGIAVEDADLRPIVAQERRRLAERGVPRSAETAPRPRRSRAPPGSPER